MTRVTAQVESAGAAVGGIAAQWISLRAPGGVTARVLTYGASLESLLAPDRDGKLADIVLGHDDLAPCLAGRSFLGVTVGRYANRIAHARFTLDGAEYRLEANDGAHCVHGGGQGFDCANWRIVSVSEGETASVVLGHVSPDGDAGFPGEVSATVTYTLDAAGALTIAFAATTTRPTIINMTNHAMFNLTGFKLAGGGETGGALAHHLRIAASRCTPVDATLIPTGALDEVAGTPHDFRTVRPIAAHYDQNFALDKGLTAQPELAARLEDPVSGRVLEVLTTEPGIQLYTGSFLSGTPGKQGRAYHPGDGIALEPQKFPDTPNQPHFGSARVDPGTAYRHVMVYRPSVSGPVRQA